VAVLPDLRRSRGILPVSQCGQGATFTGITGRKGAEMPIRRSTGSDIDALVAAVERAEKSERVLQVVGQFGGGWALLTEKRPSRSPREVRS
jgi:hypothetical protein